MSVKTSLGTERTELRHTFTEPNTLFALWPQSFLFVPSVTQV